MKMIEDYISVEPRPWLYQITIPENYEIIFSRPHPGLDEYGLYELDGCGRIETPAWVAVSLFRKIEEYIKEYLYKYKPPYVFYSSGYDDSRNSLYSRLAKRFSRYGYHAVDTGNPSYFLIMKDCSDN